MLDLRAASPLLADLLSRRGKPLVINAANVERLGGQCLQVLLAAHACWKADGLNFQIDHPSAAFTDSLGALGASELVAPSAGELLP